MDSSVFDSILQRLERTAQRLDMLHLDAYLEYLYCWKKRLVGEFVRGLVRGLGFSVGFTILGALLLYLIRNAALANLPVIGRFLAELVQIVENYL